MFRFGRLVETKQGVPSMGYRLFVLLMLFEVLCSEFNEAYATTRGTSLNQILSDEEKKPITKPARKPKNSPANRANLNNQAKDVPPSQFPKTNQKKVYVPKTNAQSQPLEEKSSLKVATQKEQEKIAEISLGSLVLKQSKEEVKDISLSTAHIQNPSLGQEVSKEKKKPRKSREKHGAPDEGEEFKEKLLTHKPTLYLPKDSIGQLILKTEEIIRQILKEKRDDPLRVYVTIDKEKIGDFNDSFFNLVKKYPFPFNWSTTNTGPIDQNAIDADWLLELKLSSQAKIREQVEKDFVYQIDPLQEEKVEWPLIYDLAMRSGFSIEDFKFNNSLKIRVLELQAKTEEENLEEIQKFLATKLPKDSNPFHIVGIKVNKNSGIKPGQLLKSFRTRESHYIKAIIDRGTIYDSQSDYFYLCLDNENRKILDLHGKKNQSSGLFEGRNVEQAHAETLEFIKQAYETFQDEITVLTGRGNHVNPNGKSGVLHEAFEKEWIKNKFLAPLIKGYYPLEGNGGYKITLVKTKKLDLGEKSIEDALPLIKETIIRMIEKGQSRLFLQMSSKEKASSDDRRYPLLTSLARDWCSKDPSFFKSISPISFESKPRELKMIFNKRHPRYPNSMSWGNYFGISINEGTIGLMKNHE